MNVKIKKMSTLFLFKGKSMLCDNNTHVIEGKLCNIINNEEKLVVQKSSTLKNALIGSNICFRLSKFRKCYLLMKLNLLQLKIELRSC